MLTFYGSFEMQCIFSLRVSDISRLGFNRYNFFIDDNPSEIDEAESRGSPTRELSAANLELLGDNDQAGNLNSTTHDDVGASTNKIIKPKRNIAKQPLLNADRILGKRGIRVLEKLFEDFEPRGIIIYVFIFICYEFYP